MDGIIRPIALIRWCNPRKVVTPTTNKRMPFAKSLVRAEGGMKRRSLMAKKRKAVTSGSRMPFKACAKMIAGMG